MRTAHRVARFVGSFGRIALAVLLLAALWVGTVQGVQRASRDADQRRAADLLTVATGFARAIGDWLDSGRQQATTLSRQIVAAPEAHSALTAFLARDPSFSRDALVFSGSTVVATSDRFSVLTGLRPGPCAIRGGEGSDTHLEQLVALARASTAPVISPIFLVPGVCRTVVAVATPLSGGVLVLFGNVQDAMTRLTAASAGNAHIFLVSGATSVDPQNGIVSTPARISSFIGSVSSNTPHLTHYALGETSLLAAYAPVTPGWSIVLEQDAADFDLEVQQRPSVIVASVLTVVFAIVFALIAFFDIRRRRAARRAEIAKNTFFSIAGHELRTPLAVLSGFASMLATNWTDIDDARRRSLVDRMVPQTRRLGRLVERLLVAASIQSETHTAPSMEDVDPVPILERVAEQFRAEAPLHSIIVEAQDGATVHADPQSFEIVLGHLVENAVKYSPSGGRIWLTLATDDRSVHVVVDDEGIGLPSDHSRIFDSFVQGESVTTRVHDEGGVGLGLFIVRTLVQEMGGRVSAARRDGGGARFIVQLKRGRNAQVRPRRSELVTINRPAKPRARQKA